MNFEQEARVILRNQKSSEKVDEFIKLCSKIKGYGLLDEFYYQPETSIEVKTNRKAFKLIRQLLTLQITKKTHYVSLKILVEGLRKAFVFIQFNESLKTGGKPGGLSIGDFFQLTLLQTYFMGIFPTYSRKFTKGNILHQLGEALTGKPLSRNIDQQIEKMIEKLAELED